ncbi:MAG: redoxin domain-containing protein [Candidatus Aminicenantes bacterium]|nr:redoxin domain-containing protein [Candidatus Aminicenantes bacterium]
MRVCPSPRAVLAALVLAAAAAFPAAPVSAQTPVDFALKDLEGNTVRLSDYLGKNVVLIDFWATWCVPCCKELPHFQRFYDAYKDKGLVILAISEDGPETVALIKPYIKRYNYTFPVLLDTDSKVLALYDPSVVLPLTLLIDRSGNTAKVHQGYSLGDEVLLEKEILDLLEPREAEARRKITVSFSDALLFRHFTDRDYVDLIRGGRKSQILDQLDLVVSAGDYLAGARLDSDLDFSPWQADFSLAKRFVEVNKKHVNVRLGDFYHTVGRGLSFSLLKTFAKEGLEYIIDTTVDGGKFAFNYKRLTAEVFGGWIDREKSSASKEDNPVRDRVYGGSLGWAFPGFGDLKVNVVRSDLELGTSLGHQNATMESVTLDVPNLKDRARLFGEFMLAQKKKYYQEDRILGHGLYLESSFFLNALTLLFEFKDYKNLDFEYNRPPLLESEQLPVLASQFANISKDITGASLRADYNFPKISALLFAKATYQDDRPGHAARKIAHVFSGLEKRFGETGWLTVLAGYRRENSTSLVFYYSAGSTFHYQGNVNLPMTKKLSLEFDLEAKSFRGSVAFGAKYLNYAERRSYLSLHYASLWNVTLIYDYTTDPEILTYKDKKDWIGAQLEIKFSQGSFLRIYYGSNKGGVKCAGGVCKFFPPFEGFRIDSNLRF